jgi:hypothetical protein
MSLPVGAILAPVPSPACQPWLDPIESFTYHYDGVITYHEVGLTDGLFLGVVAYQGAGNPEPISRLMVARLGGTPATQPVFLGALELTGVCLDMAFHERWGALLALSSDGLGLVDLSDPEHLPQPQPRPFSSSCRAVAVAGDVGCVVLWQGFSLIDLANPYYPLELGFVPISEGHDVAVQGEVAYIASGNDGLVIVDFADPENPQLLATVPLPAPAINVATDGRWTFVTGPTLDIAAIEVSDPAAPQLVQIFPCDGYAGELDLGRGHAYVAVESAVDQGPVMLSAIQRFDLPAYSGPPVDAGYFFLSPGVYSCLALEKGVVFYGEQAFATPALHAAVEACPDATAGPPLTRSVARLHRLQPNPFNPRTAVSFELPAGVAGRLVVHDLLGRRVAEIWRGTGNGTVQTAVFAGRDAAGQPLPSGVYRFVLEDASGAVLDAGSATLVR